MLSVSLTQNVSLFQEGQHRVDWARPERVASDWPGFEPGPDAALVGCEGVPERQQRHSGYGYKPNQVLSHHAPVDGNGDGDLPQPMASGAAEPAFPFNENWRCEAFVPPDERWCAFQKDLSAHLSSLGPAPVRIAWDPSKVRNFDGNLGKFDGSFPIFWHI